MDESEPEKDARPLPPFDSHVLEIFLGEIATQARIAIKALQDLGGALEGDGDSDRVWMSAQLFLVAVANVSKAIWPTYRKGKNEQRFSNREPRLEQLLQVDRSSPLFDRKFRNHFEHIDVRIEKWADEVKGRPYVDQNVNAHLVLKDIPPERWFRNLDTTKGTITFQGEAYQIEPVLQALKSVYQRAQEGAEDLRRPSGPAVAQTR